MSLSYENFKKFILNDEEKNKDLYDITNELQFHSSDLKKIQRLVIKFRKAKVLNLSNNRLISIPMEIGTMNSLLTLNLSENEISMLPNEICNLSNLQKLIIVSAKLQKLPSDIGKLQKLKILWCSKNNISELPKSLFTIKSLESLRIGNNKIKNIDDIGNLTNLISLFANNNEITNVPIEMCDLLKAKEIDISYNKTNLDENKDVNISMVELITLLPDLTFFKNDFNIEGNFCSVCKNESHSYTTCGHIVCSPCASKQLLKQHNDQYVAECPTCLSNFSVVGLTEKKDPYALNNSSILCDGNIPMMSRSRPCECGKC